MRRFHNIRGHITRLAYSTDGTSLMACVRAREKVGVWNLTSGAFHRWHPWADDAVTSLAFSPDGRWLAIGSKVGMVLPYEYPALKYDSEYHPAGFRSRIPVSDIAFGWQKSRQGCLIAMVASELLLARMPGGKEQDLDIPLKGAGPDNVGVAFSPDGMWLAATSKAFTVQVWDAWAGEYRCGETTYPGCPHSVCFTADGSAVAVAMSQRVEIRNTNDLRVRYALAHTTKVTRVAAHPTQNLLASAGMDGLVRFWNAESGQEITTYDWQLGRATALAFSPDGLTCAAGSENGQVVIWDVDN